MGISGLFPLPAFLFYAVFKVTVFKVIPAFSLGPMQAGFTPNSRLGTNLEVSLSPATAPPTYAQAVFDQSLNHVEGVNERNIVYPKFSTALQGMSLTKVPTGGFSGPPPNVILGADVGGAMFNAVNPTYFNQPGYSGGGSKYVEVGNGVPLTGERPGSELVYMDADGKLRDPRGASTTARAAQEAAQGRRRMARAHADLMGVQPYLGNATTPSTILADVSSATLSSPPTVITPSVPVPLPRSFSSSPPPFQRPKVLAAVGDAIFADDLQLPAMPDVPKFGREALQWAQNGLHPSYQAKFWSYNWPYVLCILLFVLFIVFFIVAIAAMGSGRGSTVQNTAFAPVQ